MNIVLITPIRVIFLVVLIGTTLEVLTRRTRMSWRIARWRSRVTDQTVVVGYGTKGRSAVQALQEAGAPAISIVVVDALRLAWPGSPAMPPGGMCWRAPRWIAPPGSWSRSGATTPRS